VLSLSDSPDTTTTSGNGQDGQTGAILAELINNPSTIR